MIVTLIAYSALLLGFQSVSVIASDQIRIEFLVDVRQSDKKVLLIKARIHGLPSGEITFQFSNPKEKFLDVENRVVDLSLRTGKGESVRIKLKKGQFNFVNGSDDVVEVSYQLRPVASLNLDMATYLDEARCLLHSQDALFTLEGKDTTVKLSFLVPERWKVVSLAKLIGKSSYEVLNKRDMVFYVGEAAETKETLNNLAASWIIEPGWPMSGEDTLRMMRRQLLYLQSLAGNWEPRSLLTVLLSARAGTPKHEPLSSRREDTIFMMADQSLSTENNSLKIIKHKLAETLTGYFLSYLHKSSESELQKSLTEYFTLKTCLKTGCLTKEEFLEKMAQGFYEGFDSAWSNSAAPTSVLRRMGSPQVSLGKGRGILRLFLMDLDLTFNGKGSHSLNEFVQKLFRASKEENWLKELDESDEAIKISRMLLDSSELRVATELLKPYALLLERKELPKFNFELSETFQVTQLSREGPIGLAGLRLGDRIVAINQSRLIKPTDLFKLRSSLRPGGQIILTVEREGMISKLKETLEREVTLGLMINKLADSDKREKLEGFLATESLE